MGLYEGIKDVANLVQKADNIELYKQLLDLSAQALDMQSKISELTNENKALKEQQDLSNRIERHKEPYITLKDDELHILYCSHCWDVNKKLIQGECDINGHFYCPECKYRFVYDREKYKNRPKKYSQLKVYGL
ncbi:MAG: hypothetical protein K6G09_09460 [Treponema sp.]|nr:hypothetical protein [Treponema sp.]